MVLDLKIPIYDVCCMILDEQSAPGLDLVQCLVTGLHLSKTGQWPDSSQLLLRVLGRKLHRACRLFTKVHRVSSRSLVSHATSKHKAYVECRYKVTYQARLVEAGISTPSQYAVNVPLGAVSVCTTD